MIITIVRKISSGMMERLNDDLMGVTRIDSGVIFILEGCSTSRRRVDFGHMHKTTEIVSHILVASIV